MADGKPYPAKRGQQKKTAKEAISEPSATPIAEAPTARTDRPFPEIWSGFKASTRTLFESLDPNERSAFAMRLDDLAETLAGECTTLIRTRRSM